MTKPTKGTFSGSEMVPIVADAAIAGPGTEGRLVTVLLLDTSNHPKVAEAIRVHEHLRTGDVKSQWCRSLDNDDDVALVLELISPVEVTFGIRFGMERQAILVETMLTSGSVILQQGQPGDRYMNNMGKPSMIVELPDTGFRPHWDEMLLARMTKVISSELGIPRRKARPIAAEMIAEMRKLVELRMPQT